MSVRVFHSMVAPFVQQAARALHEAGQLDRFVTSVRYAPASRAQRLAIASARLLRVDLERELRRRTVTEVPAELVESHPLGEYIRVAVARLDRDGRATDVVWERAEHAFDRAVARRLHAGLGGVYGFEFSSLATFHRARSLGIPVFYDVPAPDSQFVHDLLEAEMAKFPELRTAYHRHTAKREARRLARRRAEWECADIVIAASKFTRDSYAAAGLRTDHVRVVPYGAPPACLPAETLRAATPARPLTLLWSGTFGIRKGAHYLLDAWRAGNFGRHARLLVFGAVALPDRVLHPLPAGIELRGSIPREELMTHYRDADALVFPTLCDGFGMVATEAWSRGLPVITTDRAGAADLLQPQRNGLLIRAGDSAALAAAITWCLDHRAELAAMREASLATAAAWQWSDYRRALAAALQPLLRRQPGP